MSQKIDSKERGGRVSERVAEELRAGIEAGAYPANAFLPPVRELVTSHGAARVTVNEALKRLAREGLIACQPRKGYRVCPGAGSPDRGLPIAYVYSAEHRVGPGRDTFHRTLTMAFQATAAKRGWSMLTVEFDPGRSLNVVEQVRSANACGMVVNTSDRYVLNALQRTGMPVLVVDAWRETFEVDSVLQDGFMGGLQAAAHVAKGKHQRIAWFGPQPEDRNPQILERYGGACCGLIRERQGLWREFPAPLGNEDVALTLALNMLKDPAERPGVVLALWQDMGRAVLQACLHLGLRIGRDFELVTWCTEEEYNSSFMPAFDSVGLPAAVTWSIERLADAAVARIKQRRVERSLEPAFIRIPTALRLATDWPLVREDKPKK